ncbi:hypothetical protein CVD25_18985 [Bacillus canaveralius]|uniref:Uncharacterized protein n=1 Tax=Bacillus canaveralius TaxID=1403243 RepID=A0A2N5GID8_9BACI|nr:MULTISPECIES: hypothetical protein [Bacillus]PLR80638.1 hypothetical protein CU635_17705 [Bacillus canaveralius]PLR84355.1 hypothetical protein CVD23_12035 [Bacillus sp. V33-4]PLR91958.1 hypothetical protein CVD25_18985 [Bacillus canaveralius]RSK54162.1 hypothetical protein EJA13_06195 [Bacillus canaveralius]
MSIVMEKSNFEVANIILSQSNMFTFEELLIQLHEKGIEIEEEQVKMTIKNLKSSGLVYDYGTKYSLSTLMMR